MMALFSSAFLKLRSSVNRNESWEIGENVLKGTGNSLCIAVVIPLDVENHTISIITCRHFHLAWLSLNVLTIFMTYSMYSIVCEWKIPKRNWAYKLIFNNVLSQFDLCAEYVPSFGWNAFYNKENQFDQPCSSMRFFSLDYLLYSEELNRIHFTVLVFLCVFMLSSIRSNFSYFLRILVTVHRTMTKIDVKWFSFKFFLVYRAF